MILRICVAGAGAWGKALGQVADRAGHAVSFWTRSVPDAASVETADAIILAVPAQSVRDVMSRIGALAKPVIISAKGIERGSGKLMAEVVKELAPDAVPYVLSGPSFAADVVNGLPTAVTLAGPNLTEAALWAQQLSLPAFRIYHTTDVVSVEIGGALKNVLAIACGIADGKCLGDSARAALITRGFAELSRLARRMGGREETLMGLSGLGDLLLTCSSGQSRNYRFGFAIGQGHSPDDALGQSNGVVEGASTAAIAVQLAQRHGVNMPITEAVHAILDLAAQPDDMIKSLLARPSQAEFSME